MYKKEVRINWKKYCNLREDRVKNNCLGRDRKLYLNVFEFRLVKKEKKKPWVLINQDKVKRWYKPVSAKLKDSNTNLYKNFSVCEAEVAESGKALDLRSSIRKGTWVQNGIMKIPASAQLNKKEVENCIKKR